MQGAVFDLPDNWTEEIKKNWKDTPYISLQIATSLPPLKDIERKRTFGGWNNTNFEGRNNFGRNYGHRGGGGRGNWDGGGRGNWGGRGGYDRKRKYF